jgi:geranylgeranyl diphosphate synthase, type II
MNALEAYVQLIEEGIEKIDLPKTPENLYQPIEYFIQIGGKRIRPVLTLMATELFGDEKGSCLARCFGH